MSVSVLPSNHNTPENSYLVPDLKSVLQTCSFTLLFPQVLVWQIWKIMPRAKLLPNISAQTPPFRVLQYRTGKRDIIVWRFVAAVYQRTAFTNLKSRLESSHCLWRHGKCDHIMSCDRAKLRCCHLSHNAFLLIIPVLYLLACLSWWRK